MRTASAPGLALAVLVVIAAVLTLALGGGRDGGGAEVALGGGAEPVTGPCRRR